jgi:hypothetical protein
VGCEMSLELASLFGGTGGGPEAVPRMGRAVIARASWSCPAH